MTCPKCEGETFTGPRYFYEGTNGYYKGITIIDEWLVYTCETCGYAIRERPKDYKTPLTEEELTEYYTELRNVKRF